MVQPHSRTSEAPCGDFSEQANAIREILFTLDGVLNFCVAKIVIFKKDR
jgi:hypothetical protein